MRSQRTLFFEGFKKLGTKEFGGSLINGHPRVARPISTKRAMHIVMRSSMAKGSRSFLQPARAKRLSLLVKKLGKEKGVKVYRFANSGNHLHLLIQPSSRQAYLHFVRAFSGLVARVTLGKERGKALTSEELKKKLKEASKTFWDARPFSRIVEWGREFKIVSGYVEQNALEALGFMPYRPRGSYSSA